MVSVSSKSEPSEQQPPCELCGEPMPIGEEMFKFHGYSGDCPKPPLGKPTEQSPDSYVVAIYEGQPPLHVGGTFVVTEIEHSDNRKMLARVRACADPASQDDRAEHERLKQAVVEAARRFVSNIVRGNWEPENLIDICDEIRDTVIALNKYEAEMNSEV